MRYPSIMNRRTKIIATLGPATDDPEILRKVLGAGVDVVRVNLSHGEHDQQRRRIEQVRNASEALGRAVGVLADLQGPKIRIARFRDGSVELQEGAAFVLDADMDPDAGTSEAVAVGYRGLPRDVAAGDTLLLDDGLITLEVESVSGSRVHTRVVTGGILSDSKGLNRLGGGLAVPAITDKDRRDIRFAAEMRVDYLAVSFARTPEDVQETRRLLEEAGGTGAVVVKIERAEALTHLGEVIEAADAVLVARGDLGVEIGDAELPGLQKTIIREALARNRVVITATQMMQSMVHSPIPTRAEVLDVANAVIDGTDAVMLSAETAVGRHPERAVAAMNRVCLGAERQFTKVVEERPFTAPFERIDQVIAMATMHTANNIEVGAIIALTESGSTAQWLSRYRSAVPIYALTPHPQTQRKVTLFRDVYPVAFDTKEFDPARVSEQAIHTLFEQGMIRPGERVIVTLGDTTGKHGGTNTMKVVRVGADGIPEGGLLDV